MAERSLQQLLITNFALGPSGYTGSRGDAGYTGSGGGGGAAGPTIASIGYVGNNTATDVAGGETITLTGTGFSSGCSIIINGTAVGVVTFVSSTQVAFVAPALSAGTYILYLVNTNGATAISVPGISYSGVPSFYTAAGSVGAVYEASSFNSNVAAAGDATITYPIASGSLPTGATLNANGVITGTSVLTSNVTTYTFGVNASDGQNQDVTRTYTITVNPDAVTWSAPTSGSTISLGQNSSTSTTLTATSAAGKTITYTANALPTGLSISGNVVTGTPTVTGNTTTLLTANATSTTRSATITVTWNIAVANDPYFMYNSLLLPGNGSNGAQNNTFLDSSTNNFTITRAGNTTQGTFSPYGPNWSNYLDGTSGQYLSAPSNAVFNFGTGDFTIEGWVFPTGTNTGAPMPIVEIRSSPTNTTGFAFMREANALTLNVYQNGYKTASTSSLTLNRWNHVALVRSSNTWAYWINGVSSGSFSNSTNLTDGATTGPKIGGSSTAGEVWIGYLSNIRIVKGTAVYTSNFTPSTTPLTAISGTSLLTCQSNRFIDNSTNAFTITINGTPTIQRYSPFSPGATYSASTIGGSAYFDGSGDSLGSPQSATFNLSAGNWTIEGWYYSFDNLSSSARYMTFTPSSGNVIGLIPASSGDCFAINVFGSSNVLTTTVAPTLRAWQHVALVKNGSTTTIYVNGVSAGSATISWVNANTTVFFGGNTGSFAYSFSGYITDSRVVMGTAVYTGNFTPPTSPLTAITNTALLLNYTNAGITDSAMINNIETVGDAKISTTQSKFGGSSMAFDGTGDWLVCQNSPNQEFGSGNLTWEMWVYTSTTTQYATLYSRTPASFQVGMWSLLINYTSATAGDVALFVGDYNLTTNLVLTSGVSIRDGAWHHIAVVRNGSAWTIYIDGTSRGTGTWAGAMTPLAYGPYIGADQYYGRAFVGYIDDLRITRGVARYTANFTPPATALGTQ
jgi:hypothetical protein